jgi:hypothetical protein
MMNLNSHPMKGMNDIIPKMITERMIIHQLSSPFLKTFMHNWAKIRLAMIEETIRRATYNIPPITPKGAPMIVIKLRMTAAGTTIRITNPLPAFFQKLETPSLMITSVCFLKK